MARRELAVAADCSIERVKLAAGTVVGYVEGEGEERKVVSTHPEVTRGHIEARLADGRIVAAGDAKTQATPPAKGKGAAKKNDEGEAGAPAKDVEPKS